MAIAMTSIVSVFLVLCVQEVRSFATFFAGSSHHDACSKPMTVGTTVMGRQTMEETTFLRPVQFQRNGEPVACGGTYKQGETLTAHIAPTEQDGTYNQRQDFAFSMTAGSFTDGGCGGLRVADSNGATLVAPTDSSVLSLVAAWPDLDFDKAMFPLLRITSTCSLYPEAGVATEPDTTSTIVTTPVVSSSTTIASTTIASTTSAIKTVETVAATSTVVSSKSEESEEALSGTCKRGTTTLATLILGIVVLRRLAE